MKFDALEPKEFKPITFVFTKTGWLDYYDCYKQYVCEKCKQFDWLKATQNGIHAPIKLPVRLPDIFDTSDYRATIISTRTKCAFESYQSGIADYYPIPNHPEYFVFLPKQLIFKPSKVKIAEDWSNVPNEAFRSPEAPLCKKCGMFPDLCFHREWFIVPENIVLAGVVIDLKGLTIILSRDLSEHLKKEKLIGFGVKKNAFANPKK
jgi:hypothetical protein